MSLADSRLRAAERATGASVSALSNILHGRNRDDLRTKLSCSGPGSERDGSSSPPPNSSCRAACAMAGEVQETFGMPSRWTSPKAMFDGLCFDEAAAGVEPEMPSLAGSSITLGGPCHLSTS